MARGRNMTYIFDVATKTFVETFHWLQVYLKVKKRRSHWGHCKTRAGRRARPPLLQGGKVGGAGESVGKKKQWREPAQNK